MDLRPGWSGRRRVASLALLLFSLAVSTPARAQQPTRIVSPQVNADRSVTFRFRDPNAKEVVVALEGREKPLPMQKDDQGVWSVTTDPLEPDFYGYSLVPDGVALIDPSNHLMKPNLLFTQSMVHVAGSAALPWEVKEVPHGEVHHHFFKSAIVGDYRDFYVYTPPDYNPRSRKKYPVLYLLHGYSDDASAWTAVGQANVILDNLISSGLVKPMLVVMPLGYGDLEMLTRGFGAFRDVELRQRSFNRFRDSLLNEVMPAVEREYHVSKKRQDRAIAGLSMGGAESLFVGLNNLDRFAWVGAFSSGGLSDDFAKDFPGLDSSANDQLRLLWISCGREDRLMEFNRKLRDWLKSKRVQFTPVETPGMHTWMVWRRNLADFTQLLFQSQ